MLPLASSLAVGVPRRPVDSPAALTPLSSSWTDEQAALLRETSELREEAHEWRDALREERERARRLEAQLANSSAALVSDLERAPAAAAAAASLERVGEWPDDSAEEQASKNVWQFQDNTDEFMLSPDFMNIDYMSKGVCRSQHENPRTCDT